MQTCQYLITPALYILASHVGVASPPALTSCLMDVQTQVAVFQCVLAAVAAAIPAAVRSFVFLRAR